MRSLHVAFTISGLLAGVLMNSAVSADGRDRATGILESVLDQLELTEEVRFQIRQRVEDAWPENRERLGAQAQSMDAIKSLLSHPRPDRAAVMQESERLSAVQADIRAARLAMLLDIRELLTAEQREKLATLQADPARVGLGEIAEECRADAERLCPGIESGRGLRLCLIQNRDRVSEGCIESTRRRFLP